MQYVELLFQVAQARRRLLLADSASCFLGLVMQLVGEEANALHSTMTGRSLVAVDEIAFDCCSL